MISNFVNSFLIVILFVDFLDRKFPNETKNFVINSSYNIIFCFSKVQIFFMKSKKVINKFIEKNPTLLKFKNDFNLMIKPNIKIITIEYIKKGIIDIESTEYDFVIYSELNKENNCINKKIILKEQEITKDYEVSNIQFILIELIIGDNKPFKIILKNENYNFYIVGNVLSIDFFTYYLKNIHELRFDLYQEFIKEEKLSIKIIDHNVNIIEFNITDKNENLIIEKTGYKLNIVNHQ